jgi:hypothetical protein
VVVVLTVTRGESWLRVTDDGVTAFEGIQGDGGVVAATAEQEVTVRAGNVASSCRPSTAGTRDRMESLARYVR